MDLTRKTIRLKLEDAAAGTVGADIATLDVVDKDGDITRKGFFGTQNAAIVQAHDWGTVLLGKGIITDTDGEKARFIGKLNTDPADTEAAQLLSRLRFDLDKDNGPPIIEWSYGYEVLDGGESPLDPKEHDGARRELHARSDGTAGARVPEVSPVVVGAGEGTGTTSIKVGDASITVSGNRIIPPGTSVRLVDQVGSVATDLAALAKRLTTVRAGRPEGHLGKETTSALADLSEAMIEAGGALADPADPPPKGEHDDPPLDPEHDGDESDPPTGDHHVVNPDDLLTFEETRQRLTEA